MSKVPDTQFDDDRDVWDKVDLVRINKMRRKADVIPYVLRDTKQPYGLRAHPDMSYGRTTC